MRISKPFVGALVGALGIAASAFAVEVKGTVRTSEEPKHDPIQATRAPYFQEWNGFIEPKKKSVDLTREVACVLIGAEAMKDATLAQLKDGTLSPSTLVMQVGTTLRVRNEDDFAHQLVGEGLKAFDPIETASGQSRQIQVDAAGSYPVHDKVAPHINGHLHVLPKVSYVVYPNAEGAFSFSEVPAGHYTLKIFRGASEVSTTEIDLGDDKEFEVDPISVDLKAK
jgi:plastocyanin